MKTMENLSDDDCSAWRYMLWRTMYDYIETSILLLIKTRIDEGYALLRMASELARDIARIAENQNNFNMWKNRASFHNKEEYKTVFRFNKSDSYEKRIFNLYNLASVYGVHSHQTRDMNLSHLGELVYSKLVRINVSERKMIDSLNLWLFSFFPLHIVAGKTFAETYLQMNFNPLEHFIETELEVLPILRDIKKNINLNYPKTT